MNIVIKPFQTPLGYYIFDRETNSLLKVSGDEYQSFQNVIHSCPSDDDLFALKRYQLQGYFPESRLEKIEHPICESLAFHLKNRVEKLTLQVTQQCNLRCEYCSYSGLYNQRAHSEKTMDFETMKKSVDFLIKHSSDVNEVNVGFYGGEPLLAFKRIKALIAYIEEEYFYKTVTYTLTTNGTVFTDEIVAFLQEKNISVMISLDGPKEIHDIHRKFLNGKGSFDVIMAQLFKIRKNYPDFFKNVSFNAVTAPGVAYKCVNDFFSANELLQDSLITNATISENGLKEDLPYDDLYFQTNKFHRFKVLVAKLGFYKESKVSKMFLNQFSMLYILHENLGKLSGLPKCAHPGGPCIPGVQRPFVDIHGNIFPCERVSETSEAMKIGSVDEGFQLDKIKEIISIGELTDKECISCWNFLHCQICAASTDSGESLSREMKLKNCPGSMETTLDNFKTICLLKEYGYEFIREEGNNERSGCYFSCNT